MWFYCPVSSADRLPSGSETRKAIYTIWANTLLRKDSKTSCKACILDSIRPTTYHLLIHKHGHFHHPHPVIISSNIQFLEYSTFGALSENSPTQTTPLIFSSLTIVKTFLSFLLPSAYSSSNTLSLKLHYASNYTPIFCSHRLHHRHCHLQIVNELSSHLRNISGVLPRKQYLVQQWYLLVGFSVSCIIVRRWLSTTTVAMCSKESLTDTATDTNRTDPKNPNPNATRLKM